MVEWYSQFGPCNLGNRTLGTIYLQVLYFYQSTTVNYYIYIDVTISDAINSELEQCIYYLCVYYMLFYVKYRVYARIGTCTKNAT